MIRNLLAIVGLCVVLLCGGVALYASGVFPVRDEPRRLAVSFAGLDLSTPAGRDMLQHRVEAAIWRVCDQDAGPLDWTKKALEQQCKKDARIGVEPQVAAAIDAANNRARLADERAQQLAAEQKAVTVAPPVAPQVYAPAQPAYVPAPEQHVVHRYVRSRTRWVKTPHGWVKKVFYRYTTRNTSTR